ncbi:MAG: DUF1653 domain-containing protein [Lachnospiraceae bacterium]|nr:DUF1653 domain-containing protein [Lachnospiraceae bacterium]
MRPDPRPQELYRHFKGNIYQIITMARHSETGMRMVVYQQLYAPFEVYVRPLEMFMSQVDTQKYPNERQIYRFEKLDGREEEPENFKSGMEAAPEPVHSAPEPVHSAPAQDAESGAEFVLDAGLVEFLDADSYERKLQILSALHPRITDAMIDTMAVSLDTEVKEGDIEMRYNEIKSCLLTMERFECNRLRS